MKVILRTNVAKLGKCGEIVEVTPGYARNFLLPQNLAFKATDDNQKRIAKEKRIYQQEISKKAEAVREIAEALAGLSATVQVKANGDTIYGSVGAEEIVAAIAAEHGLTIETSVIRLDEPIKKVGTHDVLCHLAEGVETTIKVWVLPEDGKLPDAETETAEEPEKVEKAETIEASAEASK